MLNKKLPDWVSYFSLAILLINTLMLIIIIYRIKI